MKFPILFLLSLTTLYSTASAQQSNDFLVRLVFNISESRVPNYLVEVIYDRPVEKGVSTQHVFDLFHLNNISLNTTLDILQVLNITTDTVFSLNGLNHTLAALNWTFTSFYSRLTSDLGLTGTPLIDALTALQIDVTAFSTGIVVGVPDPWTEFIKGNFTQQNMENATRAAGISTEILFDSVRNFIAGDLVTWEIQRLVELSRNHSINRPEAVLIWNTINITLEDVYNVPVFGDILGNFSERINNQTSLGVITTQQNIYVNRRTYNIFESDRELLDIFADTLVTRRNLPVTGINVTVLPNIVALSLNTSGENVTAVPVAYVNENVTNCTYVTTQNDIEVISVNVSQAIFSNFTFLVQRNITNDVILGSALVCNNSVYGLARETVGESIVFDSFANFNDVNPSTPTPTTSPTPTPSVSSSNMIQVTGYLNVFIFMYVLKVFGQ